MIRWDVDPQILHIGFFQLRWYCLCFMISFAIGLYIFHWIYKHEKKPASDIDHLLVYMLLGTIIGARLGHCLFYDPVYYLSNPLLIINVWEGGLASQGAAVGILTALYFYSKKRKDQPYMWMLDRIVITVALAGFFIRIGNLMNSEIIGKAADVPWSFIFVRAEADPVPRHPAQLYEALAYLLIFFLLFYIYKKYKANLGRGLLFGLFLSLVFGARFFIEFLKEPQAAFEQSLPLDMGQILSIPLVLAGFYFIYMYLRNQKSVSADS